MTAELRLVRLKTDHPLMLLHIADSILEIHVQWCGAPLNPRYPDHNRACKISSERFDLGELSSTHPAVP